MSSTPNTALQPTPPPMLNTASPPAANPAPNPVGHPQPEHSAPVFLRLPTVMKLTGLGRSTIYRLVAAERFPQPVKLGFRAIAWRRNEVERWSDERPVANH